MTVQPRTGGATATVVDRLALELCGLGDAVSAPRAEALPRARWLYRELQVTLPHGRVVAVLGANGAGKSTLLRRLAGLERSHEGEVRCVPGSVGPPESLWTIPPRLRARRIAYLPQHTPVPDDLWVRDVVALGRVPYLGAWGRPGADDLAAIDDALHAMGISSLAARPVASLSGGERQRVLVARLLAARAPIWILDEPTTGLDIRWSSELHETLRHCAAQGHTIVMAMHGIESVLEVADDVLVLGLGLGSSGGDATVSTRDRSSQDARLDASRDAAPEHAFGPAAATLSATTLERAFGLAFEMTATLRPLARRHPASGEARAIAAP